MPYWMLYERKTGYRDDGASGKIRWKANVNEALLEKKSEVLISIPNLKVHAKICLIKKKSK